MTTLPGIKVQTIPRWELTILHAGTGEVVRTEIFTTKKRAVDYATKRQLSVWAVNLVHLPRAVTTWEEVRFPGLENIS